MAIAFVGSASSTTSSITEPAHSAGDTLLLVAINDGSNTAPSSPLNGYGIQWDSSTDSIGAILGTKVGTGTPASLTVTNATNIVIVAYSGSVDLNTVPTASFREAGTGTTAINPPLSLASTASWVACFKATREAAATASAQTPVAGTTHRVTSGGTAELSAFDTNGAAGSTSWAPASQTISTGSTGWVTFAIEMIATGTTDTVTVDAGSATITGQTIGIVNTVPVSAGAVTITGQDIASLDSVVTVSADTITVAGQTIDFLDTTGILPATITITGQDITHAIAGGSYDLAVDAAEIAITGFDIVTTEGVFIEAGSITLTGFGVTGGIMTPPPPVAPGFVASAPRHPIPGDDGVLTLQQILDRAFKQCRVLPQNISGEMIATGTEVLQDMLDALPARAVPLWARDHQLLGLPEKASLIVMPGSSIEVIDMRRREWRQRHTGPLIDYDTKQVMELNGREEIAVIGVMLAYTGSYTFDIETSLDGVEYTTFRSFTSEYFEAGRMAWYEPEPLLSVNYVRLNGIQREWLSELYLGEDPHDVPMDRINQEDFAALPPSRQGPPHQYWIDKQAHEPVIALWPRPDVQSLYQALHVHRQRYVNVADNLRGAIEFPRRWKEAFISMLAYRIALNTPQIDISIIDRLKPLADEMTTLIAADERDPAPISVRMGISGYTR